VAEGSPGPRPGTLTPVDALLLGGTGFVGRHLVLRLLERGHKVTLFCRGLSDPNAFADLDRIVGDRGCPEDLASSRVAPSMW
jgi:nucleoside-diphosphate-sugar epimerase